MGVQNTESKNPSKLIFYQVKKFKELIKTQVSLHFCKLCFVKRKRNLQKFTMFGSVFYSALQGLRIQAGWLQHLCFNFVKKVL